MQQGDSREVEEEVEVGSWGAGVGVEEAKEEVVEEVAERREVREVVVAR